MFTSPLVVKQLYSGSTFHNPLWEVMQPLEYTSEQFGITIVVPSGFQTDFATIPKVPFLFNYFGDTADAAATLHDFLYTQGEFPRKQCDDLFNEAMKSLGVNPVKRFLMWAGVRVFGGRHYQ